MLYADSTVSTTATYSEVIRPGVVMVKCLRCMKEIGTMTPLTLLKAVFAMKNKGGVLCPDCRENSCVGCHAPHIGGDICGLCKWEAEYLFSNFED